MALAFLTNHSNCISVKSYFSTFQGRDEFGHEHRSVSLWCADRQVFLATWKDIPNENEAQFQINDCHLNSGEEEEEEDEAQCRLSTQHRSSNTLSAQRCWL